MLKHISLKVKVFLSAVVLFVLLIVSILIVTSMLQYCAFKGISLPKEVKEKTYIGMSEWELKFKWKDLKDANSINAFWKNTESPYYDSIYFNMGYGWNIYELKSIYLRGYFSTINEVTRLNSGRIQDYRNIYGKEDYELHSKRFDGNTNMVYIWDRRQYYILAGYTEKMTHPDNIEMFFKVGLKNDKEYNHYLKQLKLSTSPR